MSLGGEEPDLRALALEQRIGRDGRAMNDRFGAREELGKVDAELIGQEPEPVEEAFGRIGRRRGALGDGERALLVDGDEVGEGAADVDPDPVASAQ